MLAYGYTTFTASIQWNYQTTPSFSVNGASNPIDIALGTVTAGTQTKTFTIVNNGDCPITVNVSVAATGATATLDKTSTGELQVGESSTVTLTLNITGQGSCTVSFAKA